MKYIFLLISILYIHLDGTAQKQSSCSTAQKLMIEASKIENQKKPNYGDAIRKLYSAQIAARDCDPAKETEVKGRIISLFQKIENLRIQAEKDKIQAMDNAKRAKIAEDSAKKSADIALLSQKLAEQKAEEAQIATDNATALYWSSESGKINPIQGIRLLEKALSMNLTERTLKMVHKDFEKLFQQSNNHQWTEKSIRYGVIDFKISRDGKYLITIDSLRQFKIVNVKTGQEYLLLNKDKSILDIKFSNNSRYLIVQYQNNLYCILSIETGNKLVSFCSEPSIKKILFYQENNYLITEDNSIDNPLKAWRLSENIPNNFERNEDLNVIHVSSDERVVIISPKAVDTTTILINSNIPNRIILHDHIDSAKLINGDRWIILYKKNHCLEIVENKINKQEHALRLNNISSSKLSGNHEWLITRNDLRKIDLWSLLTFNRSLSISEEDEVINAGFSPKSRWFYTINKKGLLQLFDVQSQNIYKSIYKIENVIGINFSANDRWMTIRNKSSNLTVWDIYTMKKEPLLSQFNNISWVSFSRSCNWVLLNDKHYWLIDLKSQKKINLDTVIKTINYPSFLKGEDVLTYTDNFGEFKFLKLLENKEFLPILNNFSTLLLESYNNILVALSTKNELRIYDLEVFTQSEILRHSKDFIYSEFSKNFNNVTAFDKSGIYNVYDLKSKSLLFSSRRSESREDDILSQSQKSHWVLEKDSSNNLNLISIRDRNVHKFSKKDNINHLTVSADNKYAVIEDEENETTSIYHLDRMKKVKSFNRVRETVFSNDYSWLLIKYETSYPLLFDLTQNPLISNFPKHLNVKDVWFTNDSSRIIIEVTHGQLKLYNPYQKTIQDISTVKHIGSDINLSSDQNLVIIPDWGQKKVFSINPLRLLDSSFTDNQIIAYSKIANCAIILTEDHHYKIHPFETLLKNKYWEYKQVYKMVEFSMNGIWALLKKIDGNFEIINLLTGQKCFFSNTKNIRFSNDGRWLYVHSINGIKLWDLSVFEEYQYPHILENSNQISFSSDNTFVCITTQHQVKTYEVTTGKLIQTLWLNKKSTQIDIIDNRYLYVTVGKAIVKTDLQTQRGNIMSYGDGEELDYKYEEIQEWMKAFGDQYLLPLDEELKKKYGIKE